MTDQRKHGQHGYDVQCGDGTGGRVTADSPREAREMAEQMCAVHGGAQGTPTKRGSAQ